MKDGKLEIGDVVERVNSVHVSGMRDGDRSVVTGFSLYGLLRLKDYDGLFSEDCLKLIRNVRDTFNLKTQPWFIRTETPEQRIAAQEWLFEQGMEWYSSRLGGSQLLHGEFSCLTNVRFDRLVCNYIMHAASPHRSSQEIKLTYKTTVVDVVYPDVESDRDKEIKAIRKEQEALAARLKALEVQ